MVGDCLYTDTGAEIPVSGLSEAKVFYRIGRFARAVSRSALEKKGKVYDRDAKRWLFREQGAALAATARARQKLRDREANQEKGRLWDTAPAVEGQQKRESDDGRLRRLKMEMAAAHPDRGGTSEAFIAACRRYLKAKADLAAV
jgi:hypothetical protein